MSSFTLHLLRHGEPEGAGRLLGRSDARPTSAGIAACVERACGLAVHGLISSDLQRASKAARAIGGSLGLPVTIDPRWREMDFGAWDGLATTQIDNAALGRFWTNPDANPPPDGETWSTLVKRVTAAIDALPSRPTLAVTHGGAMRAALAALCGFDHRQVWAFDLPYAALLSLKLWRGDAPSAQIIGLRS
ncbi:histidine phosphatase family protein [Sphingobium terrigena]|uniref:Histidine phosphatase family protein n=1 Tax=Sphingobium terrigena TaxID=2304063 RepID=A0A418YVC0_9SPHN|nr:histidine phosphatase family protein [Sphingobium terrigena]RJG56188.1 histidine phosphatase family protein [Sphingobium terrigena]